MENKRIPIPTFQRLSLYLRELEHMQRKERVKTVSSSKLAAALSLTDSQVRKDLAYFGQFGHRGLGYNIVKLSESLKKILGRNIIRSTIIIGAGNLGSALASYSEFSHRGFPIEGVFDVDKKKIGKKINGLVIRDMDTLEKVIAKKNITMAIIAVNAIHAQSVVDRLVESGIKGILSFAPIAVTVPEGVFLRTVDISVEIEQVAVHME